MRVAFVEVRVARELSHWEWVALGAGRAYLVCIGFFKGFSTHEVAENVVFSGRLVRYCNNP